MKENTNLQEVIATPIYRHCNYCNNNFPLTIEYFHKGKGGFRYICKKCRNGQRKKYRFKQDASHGKTIDEFRELKKINQLLIKKYGKDAFDKSRALYYAYVSIDKKKKYHNDLTVEWIINNIYHKPCKYCGEITENTGCDRIDNKKGHAIDNVIPSCAICNIARYDNFTHEEMFVLGKAIRKIKKNRNKKKTTPHFERRL